MVTKAEVKKGLRALHAMLVELTETAPAAEMDSLLEFVVYLGGAVAAIQLRASPSTEGHQQKWLLPETIPIRSLASDPAALQRYVAHLGEIIERLWRDLGPPPEDERANVDASDRFFSTNKSPRRQVSAEELREATTQWEKALERGRSHRDRAIEEIGPVLTPSEVADRLGVTSVTVKNWRQQGKLLGIKFDGHQFLYPVFQFASTPSEGEDGILRHFPAALRTLPFESSWAKAQFFITPSPALKGRTPIQVVRDVSGDDSRRLEGQERNTLLQRLLLVATHAGEMGA